MPVHGRLKAHSDPNECPCYTQPCICSSLPCTAVHMHALSAMHTYVLVVLNHTDAFPGHTQPCTDILVVPVHIPAVSRAGGWKQGPAAQAALVPLPFAVPESCRATLILCTNRSHSLASLSGY